MFRTIIVRTYSDRPFLSGHFLTGHFLTVTKQSGVSIYGGSPSPYDPERGGEISTYKPVSAAERSEVHSHPLTNFPDLAFHGRVFGFIYQRR